MSPIDQQYAIAKQVAQNRAAGECIPPAAPGVVDMTAAAHQAFEVLSRALGDLFSKAEPLLEPYPELGCAAGGQNQPCEAAAITGLRILIERIEEKTAVIQRTTAALRV